MYARQAVDAMGRQLGAPMQMTNDCYKSAERVRDLDERLTVEGNRRRDDRRRGVAFVEVGGVLVVFDERDFAGLGILQWPGGMNQQVGVAEEASLDQFRQLPDSGTHARTLSSVKAGAAAI